MNLRLIYALTFGAFGFITAFISAILNFSLLFAIVWVIYKDNPWPDAASTIIVFISLATFIVIFGISIFWGIQYGRKQAALPDRQYVTKKAGRMFFIGIASLLAFAAALFYRAYDQSKAHKESLLWQEKREVIASSLGKIEQLDIAQASDNIEIVVLADGPKEGTYKLTIEFISSAYVQGKILEISRNVPLRFQKQSFSFSVSFKDLSDAYRKELINYIPSFNRKFGIEEHISILARLKIVKNEEFSQDQLAQFNLPESEASAIVFFFFSCFEDECEVVQSQRESES